MEDKNVLSQLHDVTHKMRTMFTPNEELEDDCNFNDLQAIEDILYKQFDLNNDNEKSTIYELIDTSFIKIKSVKKHSLLYNNLLRWFGCDKIGFNRALQLLKTNSAFIYEGNDYIYFQLSYFRNSEILGYYKSNVIDYYFDNYFSRSIEPHSDIMLNCRKQHEHQLMKLI